jgi:hypothetical protein
VLPSPADAEISKWGTSQVLGSTLGAEMRRHRKARNVEVSLEKKYPEATALQKKKRMGYILLLHSLTELAQLDLSV